MNCSLPQRGREQSSAQIFVGAASCYLREDFYTGKDGLATLKVPHMQQALERCGYQLLGFAPGYDREEVSPGVIKRVYEAFYAKVLVDDAELLRPDPENLTPKARALFEVLFPTAAVR